MQYVWSFKASIQCSVWKPVEHCLISVMEEARQRSPQQPLLDGTGGSAVRNRCGRSEDSPEASGEGNNSDAANKPEPREGSVSFSETRHTSGDQAHEQCQDDACDDAQQCRLTLAFTAGPLTDNSAHFY